jgi:hypothetical protein
MQRLYFPSSKRDGQLAKVVVVQWIYLDAYLARTFLRFGDEGVPSSIAGER